MSARVAILLDGGFVTKKLRDFHARFPGAADVVALMGRIMAEERLKACELFRVYYYDAPPLSGQKMNPLSRTLYDFGAHAVHAQTPSSRTHWR